jgi:uncharacterized metal-binding protein YceD (DUF177 family)
MSYRREFEIAFVGLKPGIHNLSFLIEDKFFEPYQTQDFNNCKATVKLELDKKSSFMMLKFDIDGTAEVVCDRCGNSIVLQLWDEFNMIVKLVEEPDIMNHQEEDPDVFYIGRNETHLHISDWIYEFINLSIPLQKICGEDEKGHSLCNKEVIKKLNEMKTESSSSHETIWKGLEKFKKLDN